MIQWVEFSLEDLAELHDYRRVPLSSMERAARPGPYPYYGASGIIDYIDDYLFDGHYVLVSEDGENLKSRNSPIAFKATGKFWVNNHAHILKARKEYLNALLVYYFQNLDLHPYITGAVQPKLNQTNLLSIPFFLPKREENQRAIAGILSSLDDKIDLLHRQNQTLENIAQALFRHWFIDNAEDSWEEYRIGDLVSHLRRSVKPSDHPGEIFTHFSIPAYDNGKMPIRELGSEIRSNKYQITPFSILVSKLNPRFPRIWDIYFEPESNSICSTEFQVFRPTPLGNFGFLYHLFKSKEVVAEMQISASGTSGSHQRVSPEDILSISFLAPDQEAITRFSRMIDPLTLKRVKNLTQAQTLGKLRDTLLPKLMSGEVRVRFPRSDHI
ncbi:MAG: restriction endonuclease subunit S [Ardenticatenales bacterium]|nr:restriction endonuclease subunit S [Ardenticatenales bacterium]